jgi:hypothetical protein
VLYILDFAHDLIRKPLTLFGIMRYAGFLARPLVGTAGSIAQDAGRI